MFQSVLLILLSSCLQCLGLLLLSWTLGKTGEVGMMGTKGGLWKGKLNPLLCPTTRGECPDQCWHTALHASRAVPLPLVRDLHNKG